ncbi:unnamed protein product [Amoebophrya sp. A120]|nr:unnamed protein product [Amoebophrya sp. A120]|eukprot:GSA120T00017804001.1
MSLYASREPTDILGYHSSPQRIEATLQTDVDLYFRGDTEELVASLRRGSPTSEGDKEGITGSGAAALGNNNKVRGASTKRTTSLSTSSFAGTPAVISPVALPFVHENEEGLASSVEDKYIELSHDGSSRSPSSSNEEVASTPETPCFYKRWGSQRSSRSYNSTLSGEVSSSGGGRRSAGSSLLGARNEDHLDPDSEIMSGTYQSSGSSNAGAASKSSSEKHGNIARLRRKKSRSNILGKGKNDLQTSSSVSSFASSATAVSGFSSGTTGNYHPTRTNNPDASKAKRVGLLRKIVKNVVLPLLELGRSKSKNHERADGGIKEASSRRPGGFNTATSSRGINKHGIVDEDHEMNKSSGRQAGEDLHSISSNGRRRRPSLPPRLRSARHLLASREYERQVEALLRQYWQDFQMNAEEMEQKLAEGRRERITCTDEKGQHRHSRSCSTRSDAKAARTSAEGEEEAPYVDTGQHTTSSRPSSTAGVQTEETGDVVSRLDQHSSRVAISHLPEVFGMIGGRQHTSSVERLTSNGTMSQSKDLYPPAVDTDEHDEKSSGRNSGASVFRASDTKRSLPSFEKNIVQQIASNAQLHNRRLHSFYRDESRHTLRDLVLAPESMDSKDKNLAGAITSLEQIDPVDRLSTSTSKSSNQDHRVGGFHSGSVVAGAQEPLDHDELPEEPAERSIYVDAENEKENNTTENSATRLEDVLLSKSETIFSARWEAEVEEDFLRSLDDLSPIAHKESPPRPFDGDCAGGRPQVATSFDVKLEENGNYGGQLPRELQDDVSPGQNPSLEDDAYARRFLPRRGLSETTRISSASTKAVAVGKSCATSPVVAQSIIQKSRRASKLAPTLSKQTDYESTRLIETDDEENEFDVSAMSGKFTWPLSSPSCSASSRRTSCSTPRDEQKDASTPGREISTNSDDEADARIVDDAHTRRFSHDHGGREESKRSDCSLRSGEKHPGRVDFYCRSEVGRSSFGRENSFGRRACPDAVQMNDHNSSVRSSTSHLSIACRPRRHMPSSSSCDTTSDQDLSHSSRRRREQQGVEQADRMACWREYLAEKRRARVFYKKLERLEHAEERFLALASAFDAGNSV